MKLVNSMAKQKEIFEKASQDKNLSNEAKELFAEILNAYKSDYFIVIKTQYHADLATELYEKEYFEIEFKQGELIWYNVSGQSEIYAIVFVQIN